MLSAPVNTSADTDPMRDTTTDTNVDPRIEAVENSTAPGMWPNSARNVIDRFKTWTHEQILADLETRRTELVSIAVNLTGDFNKAAIIRANNAFTGRKVIMTEHRRYNKVGTVGTHHYEHVQYVQSTLDAIADLIAEGYTVHAVDNTPEFSPKPILSVDLPVKTAFVYGEEGLGLSTEVVAACNGCPVYIPQYGSVRSINVSQAAAIGFLAYDIAHPRDELFAESE